MFKFLFPLLIITSFFLVDSSSRTSQKTICCDISSVNKYLLAPFYSAGFKPETDSSEIPEEINFPSSVGDVLFPHQMHIDDLEMECNECHHQIYAKKIITPHPEYFKSSWIKCDICHNTTGQSGQKYYTCSKCHHKTPANIADETLSSKVVVHKNCWACHEVGTGSEASEVCNDCHKKDE